MHEKHDTQNLLKIRSLIGNVTFIHGCLSAKQVVENAFNPHYLYMCSRDVVWAEILYIVYVRIFNLILSYMYFRILK